MEPNLKARKATNDKNNWQIQSRIEGGRLHKSL